MKSGKIFVSVIGLSLMIQIFWSVPSHADRPLNTEDAEVTDKGFFQIEVGIDCEKQFNKKNYSIIYVPIYGLTERMEFSIEIPYSLITPNTGFSRKGLSDINLVIKDLIIPEEEIMPAFLLKTQIKLSNGNVKKELGSGDKHIGFVGVATKTFESFTLHTNLGYTFVGSKADNSLKDYILYSIACEYYLRKKMKIMGELYGESDPHSNPSSFKRHILNPLMGLSFQLNEKVILDYAFKVGITRGKKSEYGIVFGLSVSF